MRHLLILLSCTALLLSTQAATAADRYSGTNIIRGTVFSVGRADERGDDVDVGSAFFMDANYTSVFFNGGVGAKSFDNETITNAYVGIGLGRLVQLQTGYGTNGPVNRIRTDLNIREVYGFLTQSRQKRRHKTLADRITFTYSAEKYQDTAEEIYDNGTIGIGVLYEIP